MSSSPHSPTRSTAALDDLLARLRRRLVTQIWLHGIGTTSTGIACWILFAFLADWGLHVPQAIRVFHFGVLVAVVGYFVWRDLVRPLRRVPDNAGLAVLLERAHPELHEVLISAVQLSRGVPAGADPELVDRVIAEAEDLVPGLSVRGVLDERNPRLRFLSGATSAIVLVLVLSLRPEHTRIFLDRMLGGSTPWPQRTLLLVDIPLPDGTYAPNRAGELSVQLARGSDLPVIIRASGVVPPEVEMSFDNGSELTLAPSGDGTFRTMLRSCQEDVTFWVTGGDDRDGLPKVHVRVLQPPDISSVAVRVTPPAYTSLPPRSVFDSDVEVVAGSRVEVFATTSPPDASGIARLLPEDRELALEPAPFPLRAEEQEPTAGYRFEVAAEDSLRYRFELVDDDGLTNPDPGLFAIDVVDDRAPDLSLLSPSRSTVDTVVTGAVPVRVRVEDDFGITALAMETTVAGLETEAPLSTRGLDWTVLEEGSGPAPRKVLGATRLKVADLATEELPLVEGMTLQLTITGRDNREPVANEGDASPLRIRLISSDELMRIVQDRLARLRTQVSSLAELQREKRLRVEELLDTMQSDSPLLGGDALSLQSALAGQRRVEGDATAIARELAGVAQTVLYARLDDKAGPLLEELDGSMASAEDQSFQSGAWRRLAASREAGLGAGAGLAGQLVDMVGSSLVIAEELAAGATEHLDRAQGAVQIAEIYDALQLAAETQVRTTEALESLLERLAEWDNYQSVLSLTRDILNRQKALRDRTKAFAAEQR